MPNPVQTKYSAEQYALEVLARLEKNRGIARFAYQGYTQYGVAVGSGVNITVPGIITASADPFSAAQAVTPTSRSIAANTYVNTKMFVSDYTAALAGGSDSMLNDHMDTASAAVLQQIDSAFVPFFSYMTSRVVANRTDALGTFKAIKTAMRRNLVPSNEPITFVMDTEEEAAILGSSVYTTPSVTGQASNTMIQSGAMSPLLGIQPIGVSDAVVTISPGTISMQAGIVSGTIGAVGALGATVVTMSGLTVGLTVKQGDVFSISGIPFKFVAVGAPVTTAASTTISIYPPLPVSVPVGAIVTFAQLPVAIRFDPYYATIAFTPKAFGVIPCELPEEGTDLGVKQFSMTDADTNITIRATMEYNSNQAGYGAKQVKLDGLYAIGPLDTARGVLVCRKDRIEPY